MKKLLAVLFILSALCVKGQINRYGVPVIRNYGQENINGTDYIWSIVKDKLGVMYMGTNGKGIVRFDGHTWLAVNVPGDPVIRALGVSDNGIIYVGGSYEFGYLEPSMNGSVRYVSLSQKLLDTGVDASESGAEKITSSQIGEIFSIVVTDSVVYYCGLESLFLYYPGKDTSEYVNLRKSGLRAVVRMVNINGRLFMADNMRGLFEVNGKNFIPVPGGDFFSRKICTVLLPSGENSIFVGTYMDGVFKINYFTGEISDVPPVSKEINNLLKSSLILSACKLQSGETLLGTQQEGIFVFDSNYKFIGKWDSKTSGLPDNTVAALYAGENAASELWISTTYSLSKAYINMPYYEFSVKNGLDGAINNIALFAGTIYVATDIGLFRSFVNQDGCLEFEKIPKLTYQTFSLCVATSENDEFLIAGTGLGFYCVEKNGNVYKIDDVIRYRNQTKISSYYVRSILQSKTNPKRFYVGLNDKGLLIVEYERNIWKHIKTIRANISGYIASMIENDKGDLFIYSGNPVGLFFLPANDSVPQQVSLKDGLPDAPVNSISSVDDHIVSVTSKGLYRYDGISGKWIPFDDLLNGYTRNLNCKDLYQDNDGDIWLATFSDKVNEIFFIRDSASLKVVKGLFNVLPNVEKYDLDHFENRIWIPKSKNIYVIDKNKVQVQPPEVNTILTKIIIGTDSVLMSGGFYKTLNNGKRVPALNNKDNPVPEIKYYFNSMSFSWAAPYFTEEDATLYSYMLEGFDKSWSKWEKVYYKDFTNLPFGRYTFRVKGKTITDIETNEVAFDFIILKPWYFTTVMIILYAVAFALLIIGIIKAYTRKLKNENIRLEGIVAERTAVVVKQKEELESSIHYASRIQMALLPSETILAENLKNYFILFKPRDIVSGDFYWMTKKDNRLYVVAADCTGHGVPGAFMSLLGMSFLDEIIDKEHAPRADHVLSELRLHVTDSLKQSGEDDEAKDGMDMALLVIDFNKSRVEFSGAYNPCFRVRKLNSMEIKEMHKESIEMPDGSMTNGTYILETIFASKMPIGISSKMNENFVFYDWELERGVSYYLFSDGYIDQFGGPHGRKFMKKNFKRLILDVQDYPMKRQKEILEEKLKEWMGEIPQIDDILVIAIRTD